MKFIHTSDIHLGAKFEILGDKAPEQREQIKKTFSKIVSLALDEKAGLFLISGDLFDSNHPSEKDIEFVKKELNRLTSEGISVCIIPGNHDYELGEPDSLGKHFADKANEGVFLFTDPDGAKIYLEDINTEVYAKRNTTNKSTESPMVAVDEDRQAFKIIMAHGGVVGQAKNPAWPIQPKEIERSGANYVALGDWHSLREESQGKVKAYYSGSPEMISISQSGSGNVILGEFANGELKISPVKIGAHDAVQLKIDLGNLKNVEELKDLILKNAGENVVLAASIGGVNSNKVMFNIDELEQELSGKFWRLRITDNSRFPLEDLDENEYPTMFISGQFIELMKKKIKDAKDEEEQKLYEEALHLGLLAFRDPDVIS